MKPVIYMLCLLALTSCFKSEEVYYDSEGNNINYNDPRGPRVSTKILEVDTSENKALTDVHFYNDGSTVISGLLTAKGVNFLLSTDPSGNILFKNDFFDGYLIDKLSVDNEGNILAIVGPSIKKFNTSGNVILEIKNSKIYSDINDQGQSYEWPMDVIVDHEGNYIIVTSYYATNGGLVKIVLVKYSSGGLYLGCKSLIDYYLPRYYDGVAVQENIVASTSESIYSFSSFCSLENKSSSTAVEHFIEKNGMVYKYWKENGIQSVGVAEDGSSLSPYISFEPTLGVLDLDKTNQGGFVVVSTWFNPNTSQHNVYMEKIDTEGYQIWDLVIDDPLFTKPFKVSHTNNGKFSIIALTDNYKKISLIRVNDQ